MKNQMLYIMQMPFTGGIIKDEPKLRFLFGDKYDDAVAFEQQLKESDPTYFGEGKPFVVGGYFLKYQDPSSDKLNFTATDGTKTWMWKKDFEQQVKDGEFNGVPMHRGHTSYPENPNDFKDPFGSVLKSEIRTEGAYGYYFVFASESKLRKDIANSQSIGYDRAPLRDLSSQFGASEYDPENNQIIKIKATSVDLVYKKLAAMPGSGFQSIIANQVNNEEDKTMERKDFMKTLTIDELKGDENGKAIVAKLQENAREGYIKNDKTEIVKVITNNQDVRSEVIKCQSVIDDFKAADIKLQEKKTDFDKRGLEFLNQKEIPEEQGKKILAEMGEGMDYDVAKLQSWYDRSVKLGFTFQEKGASTTDDQDKKRKDGIKPENVLNFIDTL